MSQKYCNSCYHHISILLCFSLQQPLICINTTQFKLARVPCDYSLHEFCKDMNSSKYNVFVEDDHFIASPTGDEIDMILMDKVSQLSLILLNL